MGTREVYEEKLRSGNLYHQPTINPGLGSGRCPRCFSLVYPESAGSGAGGMLSAIHGLNQGYALPRFAQCSVTSYYAASSASHYGISQITRRVEGVEFGMQHEKPT
ncbi:unnamed protein product [Victoria cruziana]